MQSKNESNRGSVYRQFLSLIQSKVRAERSAGNRRMFSVFLWCFLIPAGIALTVFALIRFGVLAPSARSYADSALLFFPIVYSLYFLGSGMGREAVGVFRHGGLSATLERVAQEGEWRDRMCGEMRKDLSVTTEDWRWIARNYEMDLNALKVRFRHLSVLSGAVFFLLLQGIDLISPEVSEPVALDAVGFLNWLRWASDSVIQLVTLGLFLILFYLSGSQVYHSLQRYLDCAELLGRDRP